MSNMISRLAIFSILLNLAVGIMLVSIIDMDGKSVFDRTHTQGIIYDADQQQIQQFEDVMGEEIKPGGELEDQGDQVYRVLDTLSLGFAAKFVDTMKNLLFGFIVMLQSMFGPYLDPLVNSTVFGALYVIVTTAYILMGVKLLTGKDLIEGV